MLSVFWRSWQTTEIENENVCLSQQLGRGAALDLSTEFVWFTEFVIHLDFSGKGQPVPDLCEFGQGLRADAKPSHIESPWHCHEEVCQKRQHVRRVVIDFVEGFVSVLDPPWLA